VWTDGHSACIRVVGRANFALSVDFQKLLHYLQNSGHPDPLLDLSACELMDSTFLGMLAHEARDVIARRDQPAPGLNLLNPRPGVRQVMEDLGVAPLFRFVEQADCPAGFEAAPASSPASRTELARLSLEAHEELMALNPANVAKFQDVACFLAEELRHAAAPRPAAH
jgi:anti-anti-sigma regulatory factor